MSLLDKIAGMVDGPKRGLEKIAEKVFGKIGPAFEKGRPLHFIHPAYEAIENFLLWPSTRTDIAPHVRDPQDVKRFMSMVMLCVMPCIAASIYFFGWRIVPMIVVTYASGLIVEWIFAIIRKEGINEGFFVTGLLYPLILPPATPLWMVSLGIIFGVVVGKEVFGGTGRNLFNPALVGRCFLAIAYPVQLTAGWIAPVTGWPGRLGQYVDASNVDAMTKATPLGMVKAEQLGDISYLDLLLGGTGGCAGETCALVIILAGLFLLVTRVISWRTVLGLLGTVAIFSGILHAIDDTTYAPAGFHMLAGGLLFGAIFMATDPVTSPITRHGRLAYGIIIGVATVLIRNLTAYVEGMMFAILLGNIFAPVLDEVVIRIHMRRLRRER